MKSYGVRESALGAALEAWSNRCSLPIANGVNLFVPFPPVLAPPLVLNDPNGVPPSESEFVSCPLTNQVIILFTGNGGTGVQVNTVSLVLHEFEVVKNVPVEE